MTGITSRIIAYMAICEKQKRLAFNTLRAYNIDMRQFIGFLKEKGIESAEASEITKEILKEYIDRIQEQYAPRSFKRKVACIKAFFNYLEYEDEIPINPFRKMRIQIKESKELPKIIKKHEVSLQLNHVYQQAADAKTTYQRFCSARIVACYELLINTGIRVGELCRLTMDAIDFDNGSIRIWGKGSKERIVYITSEIAIKALQYYKQLRDQLSTPSNYFFINWRQDRMREDAVRSFVGRIADKLLKKRITPHMFRHTFATMLLEKHVDITYIQALLGHSSIKTTQIYLHLCNASIREVLERTRLRNEFSIQSV